MQLFYSFCLDEVVPPDLRVREIAAVLKRPVANGAATPIEAEIVRVEPLGAETIVIARLPGVEKLAFARLACDAIFPIGERRRLFLDTGMAHVFGSDGSDLRPT